MYQKYYSDFLNSHKDKIHMAAHSHHFWPNSAKVGHLESYEISQKMSDQKWDYIFGELLPDVKKIISSHINFDRFEDISFASNTHELLIKIISSYFEQDKIKILTTTNEFHSLSRQLNRFLEDEKFEIIAIDNEASSFHEEMKKELNHQEFDLIIISHVAYNSGLIYPIEKIEELVRLKKQASFILDAYHGYCAIPTDISNISDDIFYMAGGYKYAQAGEGMCFTTIPKDCSLRPQITGWFASFSTLESHSNKIEYDGKGMRFWGSTMDFTAFFRFRAIWKDFSKEGFTLEKNFQYIKNLQKHFLKNFPLLDAIVEDDLDKIAQFITIQFKSAKGAQDVHKRLLSKNILTDYRANRLRFGFSPYLDLEDIDRVNLSLKTIFN